MKSSVLLVILLLGGFQARAAEISPTASEETEQREKLFQRFLDWMRDEGLPVAG